MPVTIFIIIINAAVFLAIRMNVLQTAEVTLYSPAGLERHEFTRLITAGFSHYAPWHILMNMVSLYNIGRILEPRIGSFAFCSLYLASIILAGLLLCVFRKKKPVQSLGASIALFAMSGVYIATLYHLGGASIAYSELGRTAVSLIIVTAIPRVDHLGHICGLAVGILLGLVYWQMGV